MTRRRRKRVQVLAIVLAVVMITSVLAPLAAASEVSSEDFDALQDADADLADITVDEEIEDGELIEVVVRFDSVGPIEAASDSDLKEALQVHSEASQQNVVTFAEQTEGVDVENQFWLANAAVLSLDTGNVDVEDIASLHGVTEVHENFEVEVPEPESMEVTGQTDQNVTYGLDQINTTQVWDEFDTQGEGAKIAVLDTGVDIDHPDIDLYTENPSDDTYPGGWAELDGGGEKISGSQPHDTGFHGTHVAGTVAGGNESGTAIGVAPEANMMHGLVLPGGSGSFAQIVGGMEWAVEEDADVISMSLGADGYHPELIEPVRNAEDAGSLVISSAGNSGPGVTGSPGNTYETLSIGASDEAEQIADFSGGETIDTEEVWGSDAPDEWPDEYIVPDVSAPGVQVMSAVPEGEIEDNPEAIYGYADGTSMAAPHVSGVAALMLSASGGQLTPDEMKDAFEVHAWKPDGEEEGQDSRYGYGIIDAFAATEQSAIDSGVNGTVENVDGAPISGATVSFEGFPVETDSSGEYELNLGPGEYDVEANAFAHQPSTETVTVVEDDFVEQDFTLDFAVEPVLVEDQPLGIEDGDSFDVVVYVENLEEYEINAHGDYDNDDLTVFFEGDEIDLDEPETFDEPISDEIVITVEAAEETSGEVSLTHTFSGFGVTETVETGPTGIFDETVEVGVVDRASSTFGDSLATQLQQTAPWFDIETVDDTELEDAVNADAYDVYVVQHFGDADVEWFIEETESPDTGVVLLDQFSDESNAINQYASETGNPNAVTNASGSTQAPTVGYMLEDDDHPFFEGVDESDGFVELYTGPAVLLQGAYHASMEGFSSGDYGNTVTASTGVTGPEGGGTTGTGLAEDQFTRTVWAPSLGQGSYAAVGDTFEPEAYEILTNIVEYVSDEPVIEPTSPQDDRISPGEETSVTVDTPDLESITVSLTEDTILDEDNLSLNINGETVDLGETLETTDEELTITATLDENVTGQFSLEHTVVTKSHYEDEDTTETVFFTGPTSVYDSPVSVPDDIDSIQDALDLAVDGEDIIIDNGTYEEDAGIEGGEGPLNVGGPILWVENDGITLRAAEDADPKLLYGGNASIVQGGIEVTGNDVHIDGLTVNLKDGEADQGTHGVETRVYEGTPTKNLTVTDLTHAGNRGMLIRDGSTNITLDGYTGIDSNGIAGSSSVMVGDSEAEIEDSDAFDPEIHDFGDLDVSDVDFEELAAYGLDFNDVDVTGLDTDSMSQENLTVEALSAENVGLEELTAEEIAEIEGIDIDDLESEILPEPDPTLYTENIEIVNSVLEEPSGTNAHGIVLRDVSDVTVDNVEAAHEDLRRSIFFQSSDVEQPVENISISNVVAQSRTNSDSTVRLRSASASLEKVEIQDGTIGVRQDENTQAPLNEQISVHNSTIDVTDEAFFIKHDTEFEANLNDISGEVGAHFQGEIDPADITVRYNDLSGTDVVGALEGETTDGQPIDTRLNYLGSAEESADGSIAVSPALPEPPGDEMPDVGDIDSPTITLDMEAGGTYAVGIPGPTSSTVGDVFDSDVNGVVYGFDADSQSWTLLTGEDSLETLQALMVVPDEDTVVSLQFDSGDAPPAPGQTGLTEGWNFVTAPVYGDVNEAFGYATSDVSIISHTYDRPGGQLVGEGALDGTLTQHDEAEVSPFEGYFVFSDASGTLPSHLSSDPDLFQLYEQLQAGYEAEPVASFDISSLVPEEATIEQGEEIDVSALVENVGDDAGTQTIELRINEDVYSSQLVMLDEDESAIVEFEDVSTSSFDEGEYEHGIYTQDDALTGTLTVEEPPEPPHFAVSDLEPETATVDRGDTLDVAATVTNEGDDDGSQTIEFQLGGNTLSSTTVSLEGGESETVTFDGIAANLEAGTYVHGVYSDDDNAVGSIEIEDDEEEPATLTVSDLDPDEATIEQGDEIDVSATVTNAGDELTIQTVEFQVDGDVIADTSVTLDGGASESVEFEDVDTSDLDPGTHEHGVFTDSDEATGTLTVEEPPEPAFFEVTDLDPESETITRGDEIDVTANLTNTGEQSDDQTVELHVDGDVIEETSVSLDADATDTVAFENVNTSGLETGTLDHGIYSDDDEATGTLTVTVDPDDAETHVDAEPDAVTFDSTHTWEFEYLGLDGEAIDSWIVDYSDTGTDISDSSISEIDFTITYEGEDENIQVTSGDINEPDVREFAPLGIGYGGEEPDGLATLEMPDIVNPEDVDEFDANVTFVGTGGTEETYNATFDTTEIEPPNFEVAELDTPTAVDEDEPFDVESVIENVGDLEDTQNIEYRIVEDGEDIEDVDATFSETITLDLGETESVDFTDIVAFDEGLDAGEYEHGIFTNNDSVTTDFEVESVDGFSVSPLEFEAPNEAVANQPFDVSTTVTNFDDEERTEDVEFRIGEDADSLETVETETITLEASETTAVAFEDIVVEDEYIEEGDYVHGIFTDSDDLSADIEIYPAVDVTLEVDPDETGENATHAWEIEDVDFGEDIDYVTIDYTDTGVTFDETDNDDVTIELTNEGDDDPSVIGLSGNNEYGGEVVDLGFGIFDDSSSTGAANVTVDDLENNAPPGEHDATLVFVGNDGTALSYTESFELEGDEPAFFEVEDLDPEEATVNEGDEIDVSTSVTNTGELTGEDTVELRVDGDTVANQTIELDEGESETVEFDGVETSDLETGTYDHGVYSTDSEATGTLTVQTDPDETEADLVIAPDTRTYESDHTWEMENLDLEGEEIEQVTADYTGTGTDVGNSPGFQIDLTITYEGGETSVDLSSTDGDGEEIRELQPTSFGYDGESPDGPATLDFPETINPEDADEYNASTTIRGDGGTERTFNVTFDVSEIEPASFNVSSLDVPETVDENEPFDVESVIENVGDFEDTQDIEYRIVEDSDDIDDAEATFSEELTLDLIESESVDFTDIVAYEEDLEAGTYEHGIFTDNDSATTDLDIEAVDGFSVSPVQFEAPTETVANQPFDVSTTVTNFDDEERTENVEFRIGEDADSLETVETEATTLEAGETTTVTFDDIIVEDEDIEEGEYVQGIFSNSDEQTADIEIFHAVDVTFEVDPDEAGENATHSWEIEDVDFGEDIDYITADYTDTGVVFDGIDNDEVTVELTNDGDDEPGAVSLAGNNEYEGAVIDIGLSPINNDRSSTGAANVTFEDLENPEEATNTELRLAFVGTGGTTLTYTATFETSDTGDTSVSVIDVEAQQTDSAGIVGV